ncbi:MAG: hypothetical protein EOO92_00155 [Pedobacter sp.]|nr:MAG: hypothetical protein EOO92_00155 [Pedobacter sp.]
MLKILSYINITLAIGYFLLYLLNSLSYAILGILAVVVYNALVIHIIDRQIRFNTLHITIGSTNFGFAGFLILWAINLTISSFTYQYFGNTLLYISLSIPLATGIFIHFILSLIKYIKDKKDKLREN